MIKHAYLVLAHNEPQILEVLLHLLDDSRNDIFLHVDKRAVAVREYIERIHLECASLQIVSAPIEVYWGDISQVEAEYKLFEQAFACGPYAYYHLLSGVDLPIKSQDEIHRFFHQYEGKEFVGFWTDSAHRRDLRRKVCRFYFFTKYFKGGPRWKHNLCAFSRNISLAIQKITFIRRNRHINFQKGYNWVSITNDFCAYLLGKKAEVLTTFRYTLCPDEIFLPTVLWNSPFRDCIFSLEDASKGAVRAIDWTRGNPYVWMESDVDELIASPYLFARKFSTTHWGAVEKIAQLVACK